jgi:hypothetical protein
LAGGFLTLSSLLLRSFSFALTRGTPAAAAAEGCLNSRTGELVLVTGSEGPALLRDVISFILDVSEAYRSAFFKSDSVKETEAEEPAG